jgi:hypothetical protein
VSDREEFAQEGRTRRGHRGPAIAILALVLLVGAALLLRETTESTLGVLGQKGGGAGIAFPIPSGQVGTMGVIFLENYGKESVVITDVDLVDASGLSVVGAMLHPLDRLEGTMLGDTTYPPQGNTVLPLSAPIPPTRQRPDGVLEPDYQLLIGVRLDSDDKGWAQAVRLHYRYKGKRGTVELPARVTLCARESPCDFWEPKTGAGATDDGT